MKKKRKFNRERNQRRAFLKSLAVALIMKGKIKTTIARAKELRSVAERLVTHVKRHQALSAEYRELRKNLPKSAAQKLVKDIAPKYKERNGGYTRITRLPQRKGDAAKMAFIEFI
ncbi:MAG: 50S ribosomal protein L17 [Candidatus Giovannonibacteria bacterium]|nr:50S ribosomal protein L17 [Candidatus Giovannonibacteria bacterium]